MPDNNNLQKQLSSPCCSADILQTRLQNLYGDVCGIIDAGRLQACSAINHALIETNWNVGRRIVGEEQHGKERAEYGKRIIAQLSELLTLHYDNKQSFAAKYKTYLSSEEELRREIERQKEVFELQASKR